MTNERFQSWLAGLGRLTEAQLSQFEQAVQERSEWAAAPAATELQIGAVRRGRHCPAGGAQWQHPQVASQLLQAVRQDVPCFERRFLDCITSRVGWRWGARW